MAWWKSDSTERLNQIQRTQQQQNDLLNWLAKHVSQIEAKLSRYIDPRLQRAIADLSASARQLDEAIQTSQSRWLAYTNGGLEKERTMAADLSDEIAAVEKAKGVIESATVLISGFQARLDSAVSAALANGATAEQLQPLSDLSVELDAKANDLAAAVAANTPPAPPAE